MARRDGKDEREFQAPTGVLAKVPMSSAVRTGDMIFVSGQIGIDDAGAVVAGGIGEQTRVCLENIKTILQSMGASMTDVVQTRVYLTDFTGYGDYNRVYQEYAPRSAYRSLHLAPRSRSKPLRFAASHRAE